MKKFFVLLKKEIKELMTAQIIAPLIITIALFGFIGNVLGKETKKIDNNKQNIILVDRDHSATSSLIKNTVEKNLNVEMPDEQDINKIVDQARDENKSLVLVVPAGFEESMLRSKPEKIEVYSIIKNFSYTGSKSYQIIANSLTAINEALSNQMIAQKTTDDPTKLKNPLVTNDFVVIGSRKANVNPMQVMGFVSQQSMFIPIILFIVIVFASQMIATTIATEKENKTLETLLSTPVSRRYIVITKMAGAGIIALLSSAIYIFGFRNYMNNLASNGMANSSVSLSGDIISNLGLSLTVGNYMVLGISLFFGILAALAVSLILGAFAEDVKSVAGLTSPLMVLVAIPYFLTMFFDVNSLSLGLRYLVYAIPFSHSFLASPNLLLGNYTPIIWGILYQFVFFVIFVLIAAKIFSTDKIITMKLNFSKKK